MKFICDGLALTEAINKVIKAMPIKKNFNVLEGIKLSAHNDKITLTCTDTELTIIKSITADIKIEGDILIPGKFFSDFTRKLDSENIILESIDDNRKLIIKYGDNEGYINCLDVNEYPRIDTVESEYNLVMSKKDFKECVVKTIFSASVEESRQVLKGCYFDIKEDFLTVVALDGYRMAMVKKGYKSTTAVGQSLIIPSRSLSEIEKMVSGDDEDLTLVFNNDKLYVEVDDTIIITRLINGKYVNYKNIIPDEYATEVIIERKKFLSSIDRATVVSKQSKNNLVKMDIKEGVITIDSNSEQGNMREQFVVTKEGKDNIICFNGKFLIDLLNVYDDEFIKMHIKASNSPCVFTAVNGDEYLFLILPMRITT